MTFKDMIDSSEIIAASASNVVSWDFEQGVWHGEVRWLPSLGRYFLIYYFVRSEDTGPYRRTDFLFFCNGRDGSVRDSDRPDINGVTFRRTGEMLHQMRTTFRTTGLVDVVRQLVKEME